MPAKKDSGKKADKSYLNKQSKAQLEDIISQFGFEEAAPVVKKTVVEEANNKLNNEDEYGLDEFEISSGSSVPEKASEKEELSGDMMTDFYENVPDKSVKEVKDDYGADVQSYFEAEKLNESKNSGEATDNYSELSGFLVDPEPQSEPEPTPEETRFAFDEISNNDNNDNFSSEAENIFNEEPVTVSEEFTEEAEGIEAVIELGEEKKEQTIDISLEDMKQEDTEIDYSYDLDNGFRPNKRMENMKKEKVVKEKVAESPLYRDVKPIAAVPSEAPKTYSVPAEVDSPVVTAPIPAPTHKAKLVFSPETGKINKKLRKKYKIDKDSIFSENDYVDGFILANNETLLRRYDALKVNGGNIGRILITNKRMLFNTSEKAEIPLASVNGIRSAKYWTLNWVKFIFSLIFIGIAAFAFIYDFTTFDFFQGKAWLIYIIMGVGAVFALFGLIMLFTFARRRFALKVFISSSYEFITYNSKKRKKENAIMESVIVAMPGKELDKMVREVGALIIQSREGYFD